MMEEVESMALDFADCRATVVFTDGNRIVIEQIPSKLMDEMAHALAVVWEQVPLPPPPAIGENDEKE